VHAKTQYDQISKINETDKQPPTAEACPSSATKVGNMSEDDAPLQRCLQRRKSATVASKPGTFIASLTMNPIIDPIKAANVCSDDSNDIIHR
jgi:hypothetical protein